ncbi:MAG: type VI secretion system tip protein TssI/VgrG [Minicystis sp.]
MSVPSNMEVSVASKDELDVREFSVHQSMSSLFEVTITAVSKNPDIDFEAVVGQDASFTLHGRGAEGKQRTWHGVVNELHQIAVEETGLSTYHLRIVPRLWLASQRKNHRMFQMMTELDIAEKLMKEWGVDVEKKIQGQYKKRKYRVQYGETDFAFASRMLEEAGITFYFEQQGEKTVCVLADAPQTNEARGDSIPFRDEPTVADKEHVTAVRVSRHIRPGKVTVRDHDYRLPASYKLAASANGGLSVEEKLESYHYAPGAFLFENEKGEATPAADDKGKHRTDESEGGKLVQKRLAAARGDATSVTFLTNVIDLTPGSVLSILDHPQRELGDKKKLLVVESRIDGRRDEELSHHVETRSAEQAYHPPVVTPKPKVNGVESATVVGPPGEEIHTDEFGRVRVHFHWDRESKMDDNSSCWIHVSQPWGGSGFGGSNLPRVGQEVIVDFLGGDADRPVIVGRVYTNLQKTPYKLPANKTQSGWKSNSTNNTGGYNEIMMEDKAGSELVRMRAEKDMNTRVNNDQTSSIGQNRKDTVEGNDTEHVQQDQTHSVDGNKMTSVGMDQITSILGSLMKMTGGDQVLKTIGNYVSQALQHQITSEQGTTISVGSSTIHIGPDSIVIQTPKLLLNPGEDVAAGSSLGSGSPTIQA